ncbi:MAG TPA: hypothetical protein VJX31_07865 [Casimicrobiaceae bacterium]|nr:hypothetical protein [Casimicrobiaceae bacterium]
MVHWLAIVGAPIALLSSISATYALVPWACAHQRHGVLDVVIVIALVGTLCAVALEATRLRRSNAAHDSPSAARDMLLSQIGVGVGVLCALALIAQWATRLAIGPCVG